MNVGVEVEALETGRAYNVHLHVGGHRAYYLGALFRLAKGSWWAVSPGRYPTRHDSRGVAIAHLRMWMPAAAKRAVAQATAAPKST